MKIEVPVILKGIEGETAKAAALNRELSKISAFGGGAGGGLASPPSAELIRTLSSGGGGPLTSNQIMLGKMVERGLAFRTKQALAEMRRYGNVAAQGGAAVQPGLGGFINASLGIGAGQYRPKASDYQQFWKNAMPPIIPPPKPVDWRMAGTALLSAPFSPWIAARGLSQSGLLNRMGFGGGGGGGSGGGLAGGLFGQGGYGGFMAAFVALKAAMLALKTAIEQIPAAIERGSKLYQQAAMTATPASRLSRLQAILEGIGMSPDVAARMQLSAQFAGRGSGATGSVAGILLRSNTGALSTGEIQQIRNMQKEIDFLFKQTKGAADSLAESSSAMQRINMQTLIMKESWRAMWASFIRDFEFPIRIIEMSITGILDGFRLLADSAAKSAKFIALIAEATGLAGGIPLTKMLQSGGPQDMTRIAGGMTQPLVSSNWQRLGLVFGNFPGQDYARQTAQNTKRIADFMTAGRGSSYATPSITPGFQMP